MKDRDNIRIYGDDESGVFVAPKGITPPTEANILAGTDPASYSEIGWVSEDGIDLDRESDIAEFRGWQGGALVRKRYNSVDDSFKFVALEENATTLGLYYKGAAMVAGTDPRVSKITVTNQTQTDERAWVVRFVDGGHHKVAVIPSGEVTETGTIGHKNDEMTMLEFTVSVYGDYDIYFVEPEEA